jgi:hypothetical protein
MRITAVQSPNRIAGRPAARRGKGLIRVLLLIGTVVAITGEQMRADRSQQVLAEPGACATDISNQLMELRARCQRYTGSVVTPMGDEMFYRYQESLIDELTTKLAVIPTLAPAGETGGRMSDCEESRLSPRASCTPVKEIMLP